MKFPKLPCLVLLLSLQYLTAVAQVITIPTLSSSQGSTSTITFCIFDTVTFTATGDSGLTPLEYEFWIERGGAIVFPLGNGPQPQSSFTTNTLQDGDIVHARVWTYDNGGGNALTNTITINLDEFSRPISFSSDTINNTICGDEIVEFTVSNVISTTLFQFYVDGIFIQGPSHQTTFTYLITEASTVTLLAREGTCERRMDIPIQYNQLQPGSITGGGQFCHGEIPPIITSVNPATHNGDLIGALTPNTMYQWQSSFDGTQWTNILGAQQEEYNPPTLTQSVYFRRTVQYTHLGNHCETESNPIYFEVLPILNAGFIEQNDLYFCAGEVLPSLTVSNSTTGATMRYQWQQSIDAGGTYTNINNATSKHYTPSNLTTTTFFRRALYSAVSLNCEAFTPPIVMTYVALSPGSLDNSQNTGLCYNEFPAEISNGNAGSDATSNVGTISYLWQQSTDNVNWDLIAGANLSNYSPPRVQESTYFRRVAVNQQGSYSCSRTTNSIFIYVYDEVASGTLLGDQTICENGFPNFLSLSGTTSDSGIRYQWQMSSDNVNFTTISNNLSTLSIPTTATWYPMSTTYYRAIVRNINAPGCDAISNSVEIFVAPTAEVLQLTGPGPQQTVCPGDPIINATFSLTGSATFLSATGLAGSGLSFSGPVAGVYTLSGTPTADVAITITADGINPCADASYQYNVLIATVPSRPDLIRRDVNTAQNTIFNNGNLWYNNTLCQNTIGVTTTSFFPFELSTIVGIVNYEWKAEPSAAGSINATTGVMTWNPAFSGTATISVRSLGCAGNSTWLDNRFEIITDNRPAVTATTLSFPQALNRSFGDGQTGIAPMCQITNETPDTQYFATTASGVSDYQSIRWSIENIFVGGGITGVTSPGIIDPNTGVVDWNPNFYGSLDIKAEAINCDGNVDASSITTIQIGVEDNSIPNVITVSPTIIPSCPPQGNYSTSLFSNREVNWSLDNDNAGLIVSTATNTAEIRWLDDFSGSVRIRAEADGLCETGASELIAIVPGPASLQTLTGLDDVQLCEGDLLQGIPYTMTGFPSTANVTGLPNGLTGTLSATYHIVDVVYNGAPAAGQVYRLEILGQFYSYTVQVGDTADDIVVGLANEVSSLPTSNFNATRVALNTLRLQPKVAGVLLQGMVVSIPGFTTANVLQIESPQREYIISGTLNNATAGQYDYTITTEGGAPFCQQVSITGRITVVGTSSLTLDAGSVDEQTLCDFDSITPIIYRVENANSAFVMGLPPGLTYTANSSNVIISGSPQTNLTNRTVYTYTVSTANNVSGCLPEVTKTGTITIMPNHSIQLTSALGTDNQVICNSGPVGNLAPIEYTLGGGSTNPPIVLGNLPPGIVSNYDVVNNVLSITGTPTVNVAAPTIYSYGITTSGPSCSSVTLSGTITVNPNPEINLLTAVSTTDQTGGLAMCNNTPIQTIQYALFESPGFTITGLPNGVSASQSGNTITIEGTPNVTINAQRTYTYTLTTNGSDCQPAATTTGAIEIIPNHVIQLTSALGTDNQVICNSGPVGNLAPIEYTLGGGSTNPPIVLGNLPPGIVSNYDVVNNVLSITGTPTVNVAAPTIYSYGITTSGPSCSSVTLSGTITVNPNPEINLLTAVSTTDQTGGLAMCNNTPIQTIQYALFESPGFTITGLPNGVSASQSGNTITIEGTPNVTINAPRTYTYTLTTNGSDCQPELSVTGQIEVIPVPQIDVDFIHLNDVTHIQCFGGNDGAIRIPTDSPQLDLRIDGGLSSSAQMEEISLFNTPLLGDEYHITINGITYTHTVIASVFGGPVQSIAEIRDALINTINVAIGVNESRVTASANSTSSIRLIADEAGTAFTYTTNLQTTSLGANPPIMTTQQIAPNVLTNYVYAWSGPNGFSSSSLQIQNLSAGDYTLRVTAGSCFTEETFTINEPDPITAVNELCNGALKTSLSGGEGPYNLKLFDTQGNLLQTDTTSGIFTYTGLTPGFTYLLEVTDTNCSVPYQFSVAIPFELQFNPSYVQLTNDFCFQTPNTGEGSIVLGNLSGNAFSGGSGNFSYRWSGPTGTILAKDIFNLIPGDYTVTVTDNELGCTRSETFTISSNSPIVIALTNTNNLNSNGEIELPCIDGNAGLIEVNVSGGFGRYSYSWEKDGVLIPNSNTNRLEQLSIGDYTLTVTDVPPAGVVLSDLCQTSQVFSIVSPDILALVVNQNDIVQAQCFGQTVDIPVAIFGGAPPYTLTLDHLEVTTSSASYTFRDLDPASLGDTATISLSDRNNCQSAAVTVSIDLPNQYRFTGSTTDIDCSQNTLGTVQLMAEPSIGAEEVIIVEWYADTVHYFDTWENGNGLLDQIVNPGTYTVSVSNQAGCTLYSSSFEVEERSGQQLEVEIIQATSSTSCNQEQGRIDLAISKGYPPYTIQWQIQSNLNTWTLLPEYNNQAVVTGLSSGTYRAIISDRSAQGTTTLDCSPVITTRPIELIDQRLELINLQISTNTTGSCGDDATGEIFFELHNTFENELAGSSTLTFILDEQLLSEASTPQLSFDLLRQRYQIQHIAPGLHQLSVIANTASSTCQVTEDFTIEVTADPIAFSGSLLYDLDLCRNGVDIVIGNNDISGGIPFTGGSPYDLSWQFYPDVATGGSTQTFFGDTINNAQAGLYSLTIRDANLCEIEEPILIQVVPPEFSPFTIQGALMNPNTMQEPLVKVLPLECETSEGGTIGIEVIGGLRPLEINWFKQSTEINSSTSAYLPLHNYRNQTYLSGLEAGNYKMEIRSINQSCNGSPTLYTYYEEIITVEENPDLFIVSGPYIDSDICAGNPGRISIEVFNNNHGELFFYYNGVQVQEEDNPQVNEQTHTLLIESPVESARLQIVNELGCSLSKQVDLRLGEPNFTFTSASLESTHQILAREIITFDNVSTIPYLRSEWDFGDFSTPLSVLNTVTSTQVRYSYPVSGAYNVTLRIYNEAGCFKETTQQVAVGKGYSIILPNVFSPNNDGINDFFRPLISGLSTIRFSVYDQFGNLIYNENVSAPDDLTTPSALSIMGWDGVNAPQSPYFIYTVEGLLYDKLTVVEKTGTFLLLR